MNRRVLVAGYFYPDLNMGGVRLRRICRLLPRHGWDPVVLTHPWPVDGTAPATFPGVRVEQVAAMDLARVYRRLTRRSFRPELPPSPEGKQASMPIVQDIGLSSKINRWLMVPDKFMPWLRPAVQRGRELLREQKFDAIFASLDPRTTLLAASRLSKFSGVPSVLEFRDLWVGNPYYHITQPTAVHRALHAHLERKVVRQAARVSAVCRGIRDRLAASHGPHLRAPVVLNYNFFDPEEYPARTTEPSGLTNRPFVLSYMGNMYTGRTPDLFFEGLQVFLRRHQLTPAQFRFQWAGGISGLTNVPDIITRTGVLPYVEFLGQIPHRAALQLLVDSNAALVLQAADDVIHIPGKLFETMGARVPMLALSNPCETAEIIHDCQAGLVCPYDAEAISANLTELYERWTRRIAWEFCEARRDRYAADSAVASLAQTLTEAAETRSSTSTTS
jgi:glycosyltransferase involved in cell wall biosynthesis